MKEGDPHVGRRPSPTATASRLCACGNLDDGGPFGYALTMRGVLRAGLPFRQALRVALAADTLSILVMEVVDNAVILAVPGAMDAGVDGLH